MYRGICVYTKTREFDPGSGRTLAACLTHASRTELVATSSTRGGRGLDVVINLVADG